MFGPPPPPFGGPPGPFGGPLSPFANTYLTPNPLGGFTIGNKQGYISPPNFLTGQMDFNWSSGLHGMNGYLAPELLGGYKLVITQKW